MEMSAEERATIGISGTVRVIADNSHLLVRAGNDRLLAMVPFLDNPEEIEQVATEIARLLESSGLVVETEGLAP